MNRNHAGVEGVFNRKRHSVILLLAGLLGAVAVALGAWAAHGLEASYGRRAVELVETAVRYQLAHALAICVAVALGRQLPEAVRWLTAASWLFIVGVALFCGALDVLAFGGPRWFGAVAPLGGLALIAGWLSLAVGGWLGARRSVD